jgi:hypothetical protein
MHNKPNKPTLVARAVYGRRYAPEGALADTEIRAGDVRISEHGYDELADDGLTAREVLGGLADAVVVEEYPDYPKGPCVLLLQKDRSGVPIQVVGGYQGATMGQWFWSLRIVRIPGGGISLSRGGGNDESAEEIEVCT